MIVESAMKVSEVAQSNTAVLGTAAATGSFGYMFQAYEWLQFGLPLLAIGLSCVATIIVIAIKLKELKIKSMEVREKQLRHKNPPN